jgi:hypothetical protein
MLSAIGPARDLIDPLVAIAITVVVLFIWRVLLRK